jgi:hypothetical protein
MTAGQKCYEAWARIVRRGLRDYDNPDPEADADKESPWEAFGIRERWEWEEVAVAARRLSAGTCLHMAQTAVRCGECDAERIARYELALRRIAETEEAGCPHVKVALEALGREP